MTQPRTSVSPRGAEVWVRSTAAAVVDDGDAVYVLDLGRLDADGVPRAFPGTAAAIWRLIDGRSTVEHITLALATEFEVAPEDVQDDLVGFVDELAAVGLLIRAGSPAAPARPEARAR